VRLGARMRAARSAKGLTDRQSATPRELCGRLHERLGSPFSVALRNLVTSLQVV